MIHGHGGNIYALARKLGCRPAEITDVSSNINPLGPPPELLDYLQAHLGAICSLPEVDSQTITAQMASMLGLEPDCLLAGAGTTQFIYTMLAVLQSRRVLILGPTYADYADACRLQGLDFCYFLAEDEAHFLPDLTLLDQQIAFFDTVIICNPNNPTGVLIPGQMLSALCRKHSDTRFVIDESYLPFVPGAEPESMSAGGLRNVIVLHSLSKIFRLPGLRIGFLISISAMVDRFRRVMPPWRLNSLAQAAVQFLHDHQSRIERFIRETRDYITKERQSFFERAAGNHDLKLFPSCTPYFLIKLPEYLSAGQVSQRFEAERILVRDCSNFNGLTKQFIRIALNQPHVNRKVAAMLLQLQTI